MASRCECHRAILSHRGSVRELKRSTEKWLPFWDHERSGCIRNESMEPRAENSYDFVRFCAASAVLFSHHFALSRIPEPPVPGYGEDLGKLAVEVFFCLSGFLICRSLQKSSNWAQFVSARVLRILPNLTFSLIATSLGRSEERRVG